MKSGKLFAYLMSKSAFLQGYGAFSGAVQQTGISIKKKLFGCWLWIDIFNVLKFTAYKKHAKSLICWLCFSNYHIELYLVKVGGHNPKTTILSTGTITELETKSTLRYNCHYLCILLKIYYLKIPFTYLIKIAHTFIFRDVYIQEIIFSLLTGFKSAAFRIGNTKVTKVHKNIAGSFYLFVCLNQTKCLS